MTDNFEEFVHGYITCAIWSSTDNEDMPLDRNYDADDIHPDSIKKMMEDCRDFYRANITLLGEYVNHPANRQYDHAGHDFWLNRNRHGAGFWDRGMGLLGERLSQAAKVYGSSDLYVGDDNKIHVA